jgi:hypothetical protein
MASKSASRSKIWAALDAADATTALNNYTTAEAAIAAAQADATQGLADAATAQAAADALELKSDIVSSKAANNTAAVKTAAQMPSTTKTVKVVDALGATVGYAALYANADLSA